ncbi:DUF7344 domain-containing protein [Halorussus lipolyticus]|uniref:DUF7344 domain-containing protein n=1 Tax=Halorussus lipolyticus TaxID=3034024 RepID=UPI0023E7C372|nr:hypothetical protein [Halorussus sp. DT80]
MNRNSDDPDSAFGRSLDDVFRALADHHRRRILSLVRARDGDLSESDLASLLVAEESGKPLLDVTDNEHQRVHTQLRHVHLPKLAETDLLRWNEARGTVATGLLGAAAPILDGASADADSGELDGVLSALAVERRRTLLSVLREKDALEPGELAERVAVREVRRGAGESTPTPTDDEIASVRASLRHSHLPKLAGVGLVDRDEDGVSFDGHPAFDPRWLHLADE